MSQSSSKANVLDWLENLTEEEDERIRRKIANVFAFTREAYEDPSLFDAIPYGSRIEAIPKEEREPGRHYDIETPTMLVTSAPPKHPALPLE